MSNGREWVVIEQGKKFHAVKVHPGACGGPGCVVDYGWRTVCGRTSDRMGVVVQTNIEPAVETQCRHCRRKMLAAKHLRRVWGFPDANEQPASPADNGKE